MKHPFAICDLRLSAGRGPAEAIGGLRTAYCVEADANQSAFGIRHSALSIATPNRKSSVPTARRLLPTARPAFTLIEMLVVIVIIVLALTLAIPAIRSLTGSRSQEAAQNVITTALGSVRAEAMALQRVEGIMFFLDTSSDRIMCVAVMETSQQPTDKSDVPLYLDLVPDKDPLYLPAGIWLWTMKDEAIPNNNDAFDQYRYLGYNFYSGSSAGDYTSTPSLVNVPGGVILFDSSGRLTVRTYGLRLANSNGTATQLGSFLFPSVAAPTWQNWPAPAATQYIIQSQIGLCLFDRETFLNAPGAAPYTAYNNQAIVSDVNNWLDKNTAPIFVNRYDATLMRAE